MRMVGAFPIWILVAVGVAPLGTGLGGDRLTASEAHGRQAVGREPGRVQLRGVRFFRENGTTLLEGVVGLGLIHPLGMGDPLLQLSVRDASGTQIYSESWTPRPPEWIRATAGRGQVEIAESFRVALTPGRYTVVARFRAPGETDSTRLEVETFATEPLISDLLVSPAIRVLDDGEEPRDVEIRKGQYAIWTSSWAVLTPQHPDLWYYIELYAGAQESAAPAELEFSLWPEVGGDALMRIRKTVELSAPGAARAGRIDLAGLPPGEYRLVLDAQAGGRAERREAVFSMASVQAEALAEVAALHLARAGREDLLLDRYFSPAVRGDSAIGTLVHALTIVPPGRSVPSYVRDLETDVQRRFLLDYWIRLDPMSATPENELLDEYLQRLDFVTREYTERDIGRPGVQTDRGRIYLKYGAPDAMLVRPLTHDRGVEVWRYTQQRDLRFVFLDDTRLGHYLLIYTTDPNDRSLPDWAERIGDEVLLQEILSL